MSGCDPQYTPPRRTSESAATINKSVLAGPFIDSCRTWQRAATSATPGRGRHGTSKPLKLRSVAFVPGTVFEALRPAFPLSIGGELGSHGPAVLVSEPGKLLVELPQPDSRGPRVAAFVQAVQSFELWGVTRFRRLKDSVMVDYDPGPWGAGPVAHTDGTLISGQLRSGGLFPLHEGSVCDFRRVQVRICPWRACCWILRSGP